MTKLELAERSGVSISFLSDLTTGKANPSLKVMEAVATALEVPLTYLLETNDMDADTLIALNGVRPTSRLPAGYQWTAAVLPDHQAFIVRKWAAQAHRKLHESDERQGE